MEPDRKKKMCRYLLGEYHSGLERRWGQSNMNLKKKGCRLHNNLGIRIEKNPLWFQYR